MTAPAAQPASPSGSYDESGATDDDYDADIVVWSEHQAALLRWRAAGELVNDVDLD
ncbi:hypothetical protein [Rhodopila sp.]|uniref:hypothetical protein n=1 Tax=Rhodopila sp. TaxID=2480087 RepID=UPI003D0B8767